MKTEMKDLQKELLRLSHNSSEFADTVHRRSQGDRSTNGYRKDDKKRKGHHSIRHISDYAVCLLKFLLYLFNAVTGNLAIFTWLTTNKPTLITPWTNLTKR